MQEMCWELLQKVWETQQYLEKVPFRRIDHPNQYLVLNGYTLDFWMYYRLLKKINKINLVAKQTIRLLQWFAHLYKNIIVFFIGLD